MKTYEPSENKISKEEYEKQLEDLRPKILNAHFAMRKSKSPVIMIVSGVEGAGKGEVIHSLNEWLDPRGTQTHSFWMATEDERRRPRFWRFNQALPARGRVGILFGSWYSDPVLHRVTGGVRKKHFHSQLKGIRRYEEMLALDGAVFMKLWLHISKKTMKKRLRSVERNPELHWHVLPLGKDIERSYDKFNQVSNETLVETDGALAEWHFVDSECDRFRNLTVAKLLLDALVAAEDKPQKPAVIKWEAPSIPAIVSRLGSVDLDETLSDEKYDKLLPKYQSRLLRLSWRMFDMRRSLLAVFEGWDAAGKGGAIRRVTQALDPRLFQVIGYAAPTAEEQAQHYLWRFWRHLPISGQTTVFDRSHYGRVLVERVEGFARVNEWARAYDEINEFEKHLAEGGYTIAKFWLHISPEEQLRRFKERERVSFKNYKITPEDWRNRDKWPAYEQAVEEMLVRTSTDIAPWTVVPATNKHLARITVLKALCKQLEEALEK